MPSVRELLFEEGRWENGRTPLFANANQLAHALVTQNLYPTITNQPAMAAYLSQVFRRQRPCPPTLGDAIVKATGRGRLSAEEKLRLRAVIQDELEQPVSRVHGAQSDSRASFQQRAGSSLRQIVVPPVRLPRELGMLLGQGRSHILSALRDDDQRTRAAFEYYFSSPQGALEFWDHLLITAEREFAGHPESSLQEGKRLLERAEREGAVRAYVVDPAIGVWPMVVFDPLSAAEIAFIFFLDAQAVTSPTQVDASTLEDWYRVVHRPLREGALPRVRLLPGWAQEVPA